MFRRGNIIENTFYWSKTSYSITKHKVLALINKYKPDAIVVDSNGSGVCVTDFLKDKGLFIEEVRGQRRSNFPDRYTNKRAELYDAVKQAIIESLQIPKDLTELSAELRSISAYTNSSGLLAIEPKRKPGIKRHIQSPDFVDALSYTYAVNPPRKDYRNGFGLGGFKYDSEPLLVDRRYNR
ncbi:hypothetical protein AP064_03380 [Candidatus Liberibacter solanacearum]|nr:hypothetical protein AP064_03380 [Candidatus Liberibacter solanacearum]